MKAYRYFCFALIISFGMQIIPLTSFAAEETRILYVNNSSGKDTNDGSTGRKAFKTIGRAVQEAENCTSNVEIRIADGMYLLDTTLTFSGDGFTDLQRNVTLRPIKEKDPNVVVSGGRNISGFELYDEQKNIYRAPYEFYTRQLYINGKPAYRARSNDGMGLTLNEDSDKFITDDTSIATWQNIQNTELVFRKAYTSRRAMIRSVEQDEDKANIRIDDSVLYNMTTNAGELLLSGEAPWYIENAYELLDECGEWYSDNSYVYYKPYEDEDMEEAEVFASNLEKPIEIRGTVCNNVGNITMKNLKFSHGSWLYPTRSRGLIDSQNNVIASSVYDNATGAVNIYYGTNITFDNCIFENSGANGLNIMEGSKNITVSNCEFNNLAATGIQIGNVVADNSTFPDEDECIENITVEMTKIHNCAIEYRSASGLGMGFAKKCSFIHNEIYDLPYCGIHTGWGWSYRPNSVTQEIKIKYNYIHDCMKELVDGGLIYTMGGTSVESGTNGNYNEIAYNYLKDMYNNGGIIYNDEGSNYWSVHHNVIEQNEIWDGFSWINVAPNTNNLLNQFNYINSDQKPLFRSTDRFLIEMMRTNILYTIPLSTAQTGEMIIDNAGCNENILYSFDEALENIYAENTVFYGTDAIIKDGGYIDFNCNTVGKTFDFCLYPQGGGTYDIDIDSKYKILVSESNIKVYLNGTDLTPNPINVNDWNEDCAGDVSLTLDENSLIFSSGNCRRINWSYPISEGKIKITVHDMSMAIGSLTRHISYYQELIHSEEESESIAANSYFEKNLNGWYVNYTGIEKSSMGYGGSLGSMKVTVQNTISNYPNVNTSVEFCADSWYRVSTMIYTDKNDARARYYINMGVNYSSDLNSEWEFQGGDLWRTKNTFLLQPGWNYVCEYIKPGEMSNAKIYIMLDNSEINDVYYIDNFEIIEELPQYVGGNFEQNIGTWNGQGLNVIWEDSGYNSDKSLSFNSMGCEVSYPHAYAYAYLKKGVSYRARAKVLTEEYSGENNKVYFGIAGQFSNNINSYIGYSSANIEYNEWISLEFDFTWGSDTETDIDRGVLQVFFQSGDRGKVYIDDVELFEISAKSSKTINSDFTNGLTGWLRQGDFQTHTVIGEGVEIIPNSINDRLYRNVVLSNNTEYYAEGLVKLKEDAVALGRISLGKINISLTDNDFKVEDGNIVSKEKLLSSEHWVKVGGIINISTGNILESIIRASLQVDIITSDGEPVGYSLKGLRITPCSNMETSLYKVEINEDMSVKYSGTGEIRYRYFDNGNLIDSGYITSGEVLPNISGNDKMYAEITSVASDGHDEITVYSNDIMQNGKAAAKYFLAGDDYSNLYMIYENTSGNDMPYRLYFAHYDKDERLVGVEIIDTVLSKFGGLINASAPNIKQITADRAAIYMMDDNLKPFVCIKEQGGNF